MAFFPDTRITAIPPSPTGVAIDAIGVASSMPTDSFLSDGSIVYFIALNITTLESQISTHHGVEKFSAGCINDQEVMELWGRQYDSELEPGFFPPKKKYY